MVVWLSRTSGSAACMCVAVLVQLRLVRVCKRLYGRTAHHVTYDKDGRPTTHYPSRLPGKVASSLCWGEVSFPKRDHLRWMKRAILHRENYLHGVPMLEEFA